MQRQIVFSLGLVLGATSVASAQRAVVVPRPPAAPRGLRSSALARRRVGGYTVTTADTSRDRATGHLDDELGRRPARCGSPAARTRSTPLAGAPTGATSRSSPPDRDDRTTPSSSGCSTAPGARRSGSPTSRAASPSTPGRRTATGSRSSPPTRPPTRCRRRRARPSTGRNRSWSTASTSSTTGRAFWAPSGIISTSSTWRPGAPTLLTPGDYDEAAAVLVARRAARSPS